MINAKRKGSSGEWKFAHWLRDKGICKASRNSSSGANIIKSDITNEINCNFEVKTVKKINLKEAWKQTERDASMTHTTPYLVIHLDGMAENEWLMVSHSEDWADLFKKSQEPKNTAALSESRSQKYKIQRLILSAKEVLKELEF